MFRRVLGVMVTGAAAGAAYDYKYRHSEHLAYAGFFPAKETCTAASWPHIKDLPVVQQQMKPAPYVPPPIEHKGPVRVQVEITSEAVEKNIDEKSKYTFWTFNGNVPGPMVRARVGDTLEVIHKNKDDIAHNIDFHAVTGPGGGAPALFAEKDETKIGIFKLLHPGLYVYHCAAAPVPSHVANGMYGCILVEPQGGLPKVDKEFYVMQSEFYTEKGVYDEKKLEYSYANGLAEHPSHVVFNGHKTALVDNPLMVKQDDRVRLYVGNGGPNLTSAFHVIGAIFDKVYREGDLVSPPARSVQTTCVPPGGAAVVEFDTPVPGNLTLVDHAVFRFDKGTIGFCKVAGTPRPDIYDSTDKPIPCPGCKLHN